MAEGPGAVPSESALPNVMSLVQELPREGLPWTWDVKQHSYWQLVQPTPGTFAWTTPTGRTYTTGPGSYPA